MARPRLASREAGGVAGRAGGLGGTGAAPGGGLWARLVKRALPATRRAARIAKHHKDPVERRPGGCLVVSGARSCRWKPSRCNFAISRSYPMQGVRAPVLVGGKRGRADAGSRGAFRQIVQLPHASVRGPMRECGVAGGWVGRWPGWRRPRTTPHATGDGAAGRGGRRGGGLSMGGRRGRPTSNDTPCNGTWSGWTWWPPGGACPWAAAGVGRPRTTPHATGRGPAGRGGRRGGVYPWAAAGVGRPRTAAHATGCGPAGRGGRRGGVCPWAAAGVGRPRTTPHATGRGPAGRVGRRAGACPWAAAGVGRPRTRPHATGHGAATTGGAGHDGASAAGCDAGQHDP